MRSQAAKPHADLEFRNVTPVWLLPFWRLVRGEARGCFRQAWISLPNHLPRGMERPSVEDMAAALYDHGLVRFCR